MGVINSLARTIRVDQGLAPQIVSPDRLRKVDNQVKRSPSRTVTVGKLIQGIKSLPRISLLMGQCKDGLPLLIELSDPALGSILVSCDRGSGKTHQLQVMVDSGMQLFAPSEVQVCVLTYKPDEWETFQESPKFSKHLQGIYAWYDPWAESMIDNLIDLAEARRENQRLGPNVLLILDDLNFVEELSYEAQVNLRWLLEYGPQSNIWPVGSLNAHLAKQISYWVEPFRTRIIGRMKLDENQVLLSMQASPGAEHLEPALFRAWLGDAWRTYRLPLLGH